MSFRRKLIEDSDIIKALRLPKSHFLFLSVQELNAHLSVAWEAQAVWSSWRQFMFAHSVTNDFGRTRVCDLTALTIFSISGV
jgi:hypothetical protein